MHGHHGCYYRIDLSQLPLSQSPLSQSPLSKAGEEFDNSTPAPVVRIAPSLLRAFVGGSGLGVRLLLEEAIEADPLSAEAPLVIVFSPLVGSPLTTSAKFAVVARSPLTGRLNDSLVSSGFALAGKRTGADAIMVVGRAERPAVLLIDNDQLQLQPADDLWGTSCRETESQLAERFGADWRFQVIGPAGEQLVRYASASHDGRHAGRGGHGAVLGAKNLKAIGVRGDRHVQWAEPEALTRWAKQLSQKSFGPATAKYRELGTAANLLAFNRLHCLPTRNFQQGSAEGVEAIAPETLAVAREKTRDSCAACTIGCEHIYRVDKQKTARVEYENLFALGPLCGVTDSQAVLSASVLCDELGLDTISTGGSIAFAMECVERGLLAEPWLRFGDANALLRAIELIGRRAGLGRLLGEGVRTMAARIGGGSEAFAAHVKGLELPGYEPRGAQTLAVGMAVGARGADHNRSGAYEADFSEQTDRRTIDGNTARLAAEAEDRAAVMDSLILCKFIRRALDDFYGDSAQMLRMTTGWDYDAAELETAASRIIDAKKLFNQRVGWSRQEDTLPPRFLDAPLPDDPAAVIDSSQLTAAVRRYYELRGWDREGRLSPAAEAAALRPPGNAGKTAVDWDSPVDDC